MIKKFLDWFFAVDDGSWSLLTITWYYFSRSVISAAVCFFVMWMLMTLMGCAKSNPDYMESMEERTLCHQKYEGGQWIPIEYTMSVKSAYRLHIEKHPNDYWGRCKIQPRRRITSEF